MDNVVPFISGEEDKLETQAQKILGTVNGEDESGIFDIKFVALSHNSKPRNSNPCSQVADIT